MEKVKFKSLKCPNCKFPVVVRDTKGAPKRYRDLQTACPKCTKPTPSTQYLCSTKGCLGSILVQHQEGKAPKTVKCSRCGKKMKRPKGASK